jgi:formate C-acetyltransferase
MPDEFLDECLQVIGTGLGYPALMNDRVNIPALTRHGYSIEDARNYCFVGCIENFIPGKQPAWSDGRFNVPEYLEAVFFRGKSLIDEHYLGVDTGDVAGITDMDAFMRAFEQQLDFAAAEYVTVFANENDRYNRKNYTDPFMSLFCDDCIARGMDINDGGAHYPSAHGAGCMGIGTVADSLAAIEKCVFNEKLFTLTELRDAMAADFKGYETLQAHLIAAPKYGNDDDFVDKYAVWYVDYLDKIFSKYRTPDGGPYYTAIASNTASVYAGMGIGATPDGRHARVPLSDAASPTYGMDQSGTTAVFLSLSKPDYKLVSCGTVLNQKYTEDMLQKPENRAALLAALKVYFARGGQEVQINCVSRETLKDAMEHPEKYAGLVVRVSGFSAYFTKLARAVQEDILHRTEHSEAT